MSETKQENHEHQASTEKDHKVEDKDSNHVVEEQVLSKKEVNVPEHKQDETELTKNDSTVEKKEEAAAPKPKPKAQKKVEYIEEEEEEEEESIVER